MPEDALQRQIRDELLEPSIYGAKITPEQEEHLLKRGLALDERERYTSVREFSSDFYPEEKMHEVRYGRSGWRMAAICGGVLAAGLLLASGLYAFALWAVRTQKNEPEIWIVGATNMKHFWNLWKNKERRRNF